MQTSAPYLTEGKHGKKSFGTKNPFRCFVFAVLFKSFMWVLIIKLWKNIKKCLRKFLVKVSAGKNAVKLLCINLNLKLRSVKHYLFTAKTLLLFRWSFIVLIFVLLLLFTFGCFLYLIFFVKSFPFILWRSLFWDYGWLFRFPVLDKNPSSFCAKRRRWLFESNQEKFFILFVVLL